MYIPPGEIFKHLFIKPNSETADMTLTKFEINAPAVTILLHVVMLFTGFSILAEVFAFPEILRESSPERLALFSKNSAVIIPTYYMLTFTGITQILISALIFHLFREKSLILSLATLFGILCGVFQTLGFIRWPVLIPFLAQVQDASPETIALVEAAFNRYAGMAIGEHLGFLMQAAWTFFLGVAILKSDLFAKGLGWIGVALGLLTVPISLEPLGAVFAPLGELSSPVLVAWLIWLLFMALSLFRTAPNHSEAPRFGWLSAGLATLAWLAVAGPGVFS